MSALARTPELTTVYWYSVVQLPTLPGCDAISEKLDHCTEIGPERTTVISENELPEPYPVPLPLIHMCMHYIYISCLFTPEENERRKHASFQNNPHANEGANGHLFEN